MTGPLFFYGTLRDPEVRQIVLGAEAAAVRIRPATLPGHAALNVRGEDYPVLRPDPAGRADGVLAEGLSPAAFDRVAFFEATFGYYLDPVRVETAEGPAEARVWVDPAADPDGPWDIARWEARQKPAFLEQAREFMDHLGMDPARALAAFPGIVMRAEARAAAAAETPVTRLRRGFTRDDVELLGIERPWIGFFAIEQHRLRHRRFDGTMTEPITRAVFTSGDAVTVLPWDRRRDRVLLIEQWRAGPWARGDRAPWCLEAIAGRCGMGEEEEGVARREAAEEAGLTLGRLALVARYYPTPGAVAERLTSYIGEADLPGEGGIHGLAEEHEDIRGLVVPLDAALDAIATGEIANAPLLLSLLWLARERDRLARDWA